MRPRLLAGSPLSLHLLCSACICHIYPELIPSPHARHPPSPLPPSSSFSLLLLLLPPSSSFSYSLCALHLVLCFLSNISFLTAHRAATATPPPCLPTSLPPSLLYTSSPHSLLLQLANLLATFFCCLFRCASFANFANFRQLNKATRTHYHPPPRLLPLSCPLFRPPTAPPFSASFPLPCWRCHWLQVSALLSFLLNTMEIAGPRLLFATPLCLLHHSRAAGSPCWSTPLLSLFHCILLVCHCAGKVLCHVCCLPCCAYAAFATQSLPLPVTLTLTLSLSLSLFFAVISVSCRLSPVADEMFSLVPA